MSELVSACCHADQALLGSLLVDAADPVSAGEFAILGDLQLIDKKDGVSSFDALRWFSIDASAMSEPAKLALLSPCLPDVGEVVAGAATSWARLEDAAAWASGPLVRQLENRWLC